MTAIIVINMHMTMIDMINSFVFVKSALDIAIQVGANIAILARGILCTHIPLNHLTAMARVQLAHRWRWALSFSLRSPRGWLCYALNFW
jgi:hypothetical protein